MKKEIKNIEENLKKFREAIESLKSATKDVMPLVAKSLELTLEIIKTYEEAIKEVWKLDNK